MVRTSHKARVHDRWYKRGPDGRRNVPTALYGKGNRWQVKYIDPTGIERGPTYAKRHGVGGAEEGKTHIEATLRNGLYIDPDAGKITFKDYVEKHWTPDQVDHRDLTASRVARTFKLHIFPLLGDMQLARIKPDDIRRWRDDRKNHLAPSSLEVAFGELKAVFNAAVSSRRIAESPCKTVSVATPNKTRAVPPTTAQVQAVIAAAPSRYKAAIVLGASTGIRNGEVLAVSRETLNLEVGELDVDRQLVTPDGGVPYIGRTKTDSSARKVPLSKSVVTCLREHIDQYPPVAVKIMDKRADTPVEVTTYLLFTTESGRAIRRRNWCAMMRMTSRRAARALAAQEDEAAGRPVRKLRTNELFRIKFHDLRHYVVSLLISSGASVKEIQALVGHRLASTTLDTYGHLWPGSDDRLRAALEAELFEEKT
jgi:integrase